MKADAAIELAKQLRAGGVKRVEFGEGDEIRALELHEPGAPIIEPSEDDGKNNDMDPNNDPSTAPYVQALRQMQTGSFKGAARASEGDE